MNFLILGELFKRMNEGGPFFMYPIFLMLLICIGLIVFSFLKQDLESKLKELISHVSLFALVWGFLGMMIGLITAFDAISSIEYDVATQVLAGGLKIGLLSPTFGIFTFLVARFGIIVLHLRKSKNA